MVDRFPWAACAIAGFATTAGIATAVPTQAQAPEPRPSLNLYGTTGLIDMPSAQAQPDGQLGVSYSQFGNTARRNFTFQILPRLSGTLRYATIHDWTRPDDPDYDLFDRSFDIQFQLLEERDWQPALAVGLRDFVGTGVYSGEYVVATKTVAEDFTFTLGMGWGRLAGVGSFENPFCTVSDSMCERENDFEQGGKLSTDTWFRGEDVGIFGGVEWRTPIENFTLKAEYSSDTYDQESDRTDFERKSPLNFGAEYRLWNAVTLGGYYMYGDTFGFNVAISGNPYEPPTPQNLGPGPVPIIERPYVFRDNVGWVDDPKARDQLTQGVADALRGEGLTLDQIKFSPRVVDVVIVNRRINAAPKAIGRTAHILATAMPYSVETFRISTLEGGLPTTTVTISRTDLENQVNRPNAGLASWQSVDLDGAVPSLGGQVWSRDVYPLYDWALIPVPTLQLFAGEDGFRPQLTAEFRGSVSISPHLSFSTRIRQPILGAFDDPGPEEEERALPPVRRESARYYADYNPKLMRLTGDYLFKLNRNTYARGSAGFLERQYAGFSGEVLWKPVEQDWGLGLELNHVWQRDFDDFIGFDYYDYDVTTGHASLYWDTGYKGIEAQIDAGRYLAKDWGATFSLTRYFPNGWSVGAFATLTDVTEDDFGEGSFDKGITLTIPLRWATPFETRQKIDGSLRSLSSDGGARLNIANRLYPIIREQDAARLERNWGAFWE